MRSARRRASNLGIAIAAAVTFCGLATGAVERDAGRAVGADLGLAQLAGQEGCVAQTDPEDEEAVIAKGCRAGRGLLGVAAVAVTPDGANLYTASWDSSAVGSFSRDALTGRLIQTSCTSQNGTNGVDGTARACIDGDAIRGATALAVSPDGKHVYSAAFGSGGIGVFTRDGRTGSLLQTGCVRPVRTCTGASALGGAAAIAVSPDGAHVYVASADADAVVMLTRNQESGALKPLGCISDDGTDRLCAKGNALRGADAIVVSQDGKFVYVAAGSSDAVLTFTRDPATGLLRQSGCLMDAAPRGGSCTRAIALDGPSALVLAPDGTTLFAAAYGSNAVSVITRNPTTGALRQAGCVSEVYEFDENENGKIEGDELVRDGCVHVGSLSSPSGLAVSPDGLRLYVAVYAGLTVFTRDRSTGGLVEAGCIATVQSEDEEDEDSDETERSPCMLARGVGGASGVVLSPDGRNVYLASSSYGAVVVLGPGVSTSAWATAGGRTLTVSVACPSLHLGPCRGLLALNRARPRKALVRPRSYAVQPGTAALYTLPLRKLALATRAPRRLVPALLAATDAEGAADPNRQRLLLRGVRIAPRRAQAPPRPAPKWSP